MKSAIVGKENVIRWAFFMTGILLLALGVALTIKAKGLGLSPWELFHYGLYLQFGLSIGTWSIIVGFTIVLTTACLTKTYPRVGTYLNMLLVGVFIDIFNWIIPDTNRLWLEITLLLVGIMIMAVGVGAYVAPSLGAGPRDSVMLGISKQMGWKVGRVRNAIELVVCLAGWMLGGPIGIGTVLIALLLGTIVGYAIPYAEKTLKFVLKRGGEHENFNQGPLRVNHND